VRKLRIEDLSSAKQDLALMTLLRRTTSLTILAVGKATDESVEELFQAAGQLARLHTFMLVITEEPLHWTSQLASIITRSFPSLVYFNLHVTEFELRESIGRYSPVRPSPKQLQKISLHDGLRSREDASFYDSIMQFCDPSCLVEVEVAGGLVSTSVFERLSYLPNLRCLLIEIEMEENGIAMAEIIPHLPKMKALEILCIEPFSEVATPVDSAVSLKTLLQTLPPTIKVTSTFDLRFRPEEFHPIPLQEVPVSWPSSLSILQVCCTSNAGNDLLLWRDKADKLGKWHRYEEDLQAAEEMLR
jgi:hypothetical protein